MQVSVPSNSSVKPVYFKGSSHTLGVNATLSDLPLYSFTVSEKSTIKSLTEHFSNLRSLPGVVIQKGDYVGVLSRQHFLEYFLQVGHTALFQDGTVRLLLNQSNRNALVLSEDVPVLIAAQQALKRPAEEQNEPVLVERDNQYYLLDSDLLNVTHWHIRGIETQIRYERLQMQLLQSEKMAALGRLVDGVAHEILDPVSFIWGNLSYIAEYSNQQSELLAAYEAAFPQPTSEINELKNRIEFDYLREDFPAAIKSARSGAHRLRQLATSLQNFCHIDEVHPRPTDINALLDSTLRLLKNKINGPISIESCYGKLPPVPCFPGQLSQVFMNIFTNAIDSLLAQSLNEYDPIGSQSNTPEIKVTTTVCSVQDDQQTAQHVARWISIIISDNGPGLSPEIEAKILESFSTKNRIRKETGLAMSYRIITAKHGGRMWLRSLHNSETTEVTDSDKTTYCAQPPVSGTEIEILLPLTTCEED